MNDNDIERVLKGTGPRDRPPADVESSVREHLRGEWRSIVAEGRARRQWRTGLALAASLAVAALGIWLSGPLLTGSGEVVATMALASGDVRAKEGLLGRWQPVGDDQSLHAGEALLTGSAGRGSLSLPGGVSLRLDHDTLITLTSADRVDIERGAMYVDAGRESVATAPLTVVTSAGELRHVGTQYEVRLLGTDVRVRVREGHVEWSDAQGRAARGAVGDQLTIAADGAIARDVVPPYGESWDWVAAAAPGIDIDGRPLTEFLDWAGRELGREIAFVNADVASEAAGVTVHGSIAGLTPAQALDAVLATTRLQGVMDDGRILIGLQDTGRQPSVESSSTNPAT
jgi:ferric-dicitrate binding protein FerR (iron transport regulator)